MLPFRLSDPALYLGIHGGACALFLLLAFVLWRDGRASMVARLSAGLAVGGAASAITSAPGFRDDAVGWQMPLLALSWGTPALFWLWARAGFGEQVRLRLWHGAAWLAMAAAGTVSSYRGGAIATVAPILALAFALLAVMQTLTTWRDDLVARRRRLRVVVLLGIVALIAGNAWSELETSQSRSSRSGGQGFALLVLAAVATAGLLRMARPAPMAALLPPPAAPVPPAPTPDQAADLAADLAIDPALLRSLQRLMTAERAYREEGLTIGVLATRLGVPEHRLRQAINHGLGERNFNTFVNRYRIEDTKTALADPAQREVPILTIAMDAGFQSLGPFNRAFKADTGVTPSEYRRRALAE